MAGRICLDDNPTLQFKLQRTSKGAASEVAESHLGTRCVQQGKTISDQDIGSFIAAADYRE
jgi:hypothetical protein